MPLAHSAPPHWAGWMVARKALLVILFVCLPNRLPRQGDDGRLGNIIGKQPTHSVHLQSKGIIIIIPKTHQKLTPRVRRASSWLYSGDPLNSRINYNVCLCSVHWSGLVPSQRKRSTHLINTIYRIVALLGAINCAEMKFIVPNKLGPFGSVAGVGGREHGVDSLLTTNQSGRIKACPTRGHCG